MSRKKLQQFDEIKLFSNVLEKPLKMKGQWNSFFQNDHDIILELACGKGEYTISLAETFPASNFIGIDRKGNRIWKGAKIALERSLNNVAFLRIDIAMIDQYFDKDEVSEIWITFPDPFPKDKHEKHRLTYKNYLFLFQKILKSNGRIHLKTDAKNLYEYSKQSLKQYGATVLEDISDLYNSQKSEDPSLSIKTTYEKKHLAQGKKIYYLCFTLPSL